MDTGLALDANLLTPIELIRATVDGMIARRFGRIVNITSSSVQAPIEILGLSNGARAGLTGFVAGLARKTVRHNVTINNILPGQFITDRLKANLEASAKNAGVSYDDFVAARKKVIPAGRFGDPAEFIDDQRARNKEFLHAPYLDTFYPIAATDPGRPSRFTGDFGARGVQAIDAELATIHYVALDYSFHSPTLVLVNEMGTHQAPEDDCIVFFQTGLGVPPGCHAWTVHL